jgi:hypothetical protein
VIVKVTAVAAIGAFVIPGPTSAQMAGLYDGVYDLRSTSLVPGSAADYGRRPCSLALHAGPLEIVGGHAATICKRSSDAAGDVGPRGELTLIDSGAFLEFTGKIDIHGALRGYLNTFDGCGYDLIFQKRRVE